MRADFLHLSDVHLGYRQYGSDERFNDFGRAFLHAVEGAVETGVDFVLISGDLFHKSAIDPPTLLQAVAGLDRLRRADITTVAVVGNHDRARYRDHISWLDYLSERGYLALLSPTFAEEAIKLQPWDGESGAYIDLNGVRVIGLPYLGASTNMVLRDLVDALAAEDSEGIEFTILMAHFGLEGEIPGLRGGVSYNLLQPLKEHVDYLALGHLHKPFQRDGWVYNPGSLEACGMDESRWEGGSYHVVIDTDRQPKHRAKHQASPRRPFHRWSCALDAYHTPEAFHQGLRAFLEDKAQQIEREPAPKPVVEVALEGVLAFDRAALEMLHVQELIQDTLDPLLVRLKNNTRPTEFEISPEQRLSRSELEREVLLDLVRRDSRYRGRAEFWADLMREVKAQALAGSAAESILQHLRSRMAEEGG